MRTYNFNTCISSVSLRPISLKKKVMGRYLQAESTSFRAKLTDAMRGTQQLQPNCIHDATICLSILEQFIVKEILAKIKC